MKFVQPIAYYFDPPDVNEETVKIIGTLQSIGLDVVALVHDMGSNLLATKKFLGISSECSSFEVNNRQVKFNL